MARVDFHAGRTSLTGHDIEDLREELSTLRKEVQMLRLANAELERVVVRDTLTPLYNRRYFISCVNDRISRASRYDAQAVLMLIDVDNMKGINDLHGHGAGDFVLLHIAEMLAGAIRSTDIAARIGGDEFALILDEMDEAQAAQKLEALDRMVRETPCMFGDDSLPVSASFGFAEIKPFESDAATIARADERMYVIKRQRQSER